MTRSESTSRPRSQTALAKRSTSTVVLPVPAPAETKTTPPAAMAASCSGLGARTSATLMGHPVAHEGVEGVWGNREVPPRHQRRGLVGETWFPPRERAKGERRSCAAHPAHAVEVAPGGAAGVTERVVADVAPADAPDEAPRVLRRPLDLGPELLLVPVVRLGETGQVLGRGGAQEPARATLPREGAVEATERLDPHEVAEDEHVERDLEPELGVDLRGRVGGLPRLVVLDDPARAERVDIDPVDLPGEREAAEVEPALELGRGALGAEGDLEAARDERRLRLGLGADEALEVAAEPAVQLAPVELRELLADSVERIVQAPTEEADGVLDVAGLHALRAELLRKAAEEPAQSGVRERAPELRVHLGVDLLRRDDPLEEPDRGARGERLELRRVENGSRAERGEDGGVSQLCGALERATGALESPVPAVRARERLGAARVGRAEAGEGAQALALGRRLFQRPGERRERPPARPAGDLGGVEERTHLVPEGARLPRAALVGRRLPHEGEPARGPGAGGVEEIALAADRVGPDEPRAVARVDLAPGLVVRAGRCRSTARQASLLEPENEDDLEAAGSRPPGGGERAPARPPP